MATLAPEQKITPFLWFNTEAQEAARFYTSLFKNSRITTVTHYGEGAPMPKGTVLTVAFELAGQEFVALNGGPMFKFTEAVSFAINCDSQSEIDEYWEKLLSGGGQAQVGGWLKDRFGLSWQVVPTELLAMLTGPNAERVMKALVQMIKLDLSTLMAAAAGR